MNNESRDAIVIGAGAAGMMAAYSAASTGKKVIIFEKNDRPGKKIFITGKGRCNITNASDVEQILNNIVTNKKFLYSAIYTYTNDSVIDFFENAGVKTKIERGNRVFPESDKSSDVINALKHQLQNNNVEIIYNTEVKDLIIEESTVKGIITKYGDKYFAKNVIIATGGMSYPVTGSDGYGIKLMEKCGHLIKDMYPALVPMNVKEEFIKELQGLSLKNVRGSFYLTSKQTKKPIYEDFGEMLFTHFGISGPIVLSASSFVAKYIKNENLIFSIDFKPALSKEKLDERILREFESNINRDFRNSLDTLLPKKLIPVIIDYCKIDPYKKVNVISKEERSNLVDALKEFKMTVISFRGFNEAIVTQGGVSVKNINPATMESKIINHLFLAGEMIDVDAVTGGYNLQIAWSTGYLAGSSVY